MIEEKKYDEVLSVLIKAYEDRTLIRGVACRCLMGNLVAHYSGSRIARNSFGLFWAGPETHPMWQDVFSTGIFDGQSAKEVQERTPWVRIVLRERALPNNKVALQLQEGCSIHGMKQLDILPYPPELLEEIEFEYEVASEKGDTEEEQMFNGLMACIEILDRYHQVDEKRQGESKTNVRQAYTKRKSYASSNI